MDNTKRYSVFTDAEVAQFKGSEITLIEATDWFGLFAFWMFKKKIFLQRTHNKMIVKDDALPAKSKFTQPAWPFKGNV